MKWFGGVEAGGTKFNCIVASDPDNILEEARIRTTTPAETLPQVVDFFEWTQHKHHLSLDAIGLGFFGPISLDPAAKDFGYITSTPKLAWRNTPIVSYFKEKMYLPVAFDTDVAAAAVGEGLWGAARSCKHFIYITVGTGVGGGVINDGKPLHGQIHPEIGHMFLPHDLHKDPFEGYCPSHKDCLEGLVSGPAIKARWGQAAETLPASHPAWDLESDYMSYALANLIVSFSPERIILGGGVMKIPGLIEQIRAKTLVKLNGYVQNENLIYHTNEYIQLPGLADRAGTLGSIALAQTVA